MNTTPPDELQAKTPKKDDRPQRYSWAPGNYWHECPTCSEAFWGDKRAGLCADCAYSIMGTIEEHPPKALNSELTRLRATIVELREERDRLAAALESSHMGRAVVHWMRAYNSLKVSDDNDANCQIVRVPKHMIPDGAKLVEAYETERQFIVLGHPDSEDESHNCDEMGCSTLSHVMARVDKPPALAAESQPPDAAGDSSGREG